MLSKAIHTISKSTRKRKRSATLLPRKQDLTHFFHSFLVRSDPITLRQGGDREQR